MTVMAAVVLWTDDVTLAGGNVTLSAFAVK